ncbi:potassium channel family protein [Pseudonocardia acaciae]|uniref:potassium channel family protein n=1 Tax=Pseudonocardia acaciae TaxID=551276 RepID=UPI0006863307|nr:NAD-binding protein [Pseudonocardia acaciae]
MIDPARPRSSRRRNLIICGDNPLAYRLAAELADQSSAEVTVIVRSIEANWAPRIAELAGVQLVELPELSVGAFRAAGLADADALALVEQDDVGNIHAALRAHELNPNLRLVIRFFNMSLGYRIRELFPGSVVLSDSSTAAPSFVAAVLDEVAPGTVRLPGRHGPTVFVARRADVPASRVVCGLADTRAPGGPVRLPPDEDGADLVLALAGEGVLPVGRRRWRGRGLALTRLRGLLNRKLALAALLLVVLLGVGTTLFAMLSGHSLGDAVYLTVLDAAGAAEPNTRLGLPEKIVQSMITIVGIAIIPVVTAAVVDALVTARLTGGAGRPRRMSGHVVLVGLGNVGARVLAQLHDAGVPVVAVDSDERARGVPRARRSGIPVVIGDASREEILREARLDASRALVAVTNNDVTNLEAGLHGRAMRDDLRVVLRLFDDDLARRVQETFGIDVSRSVSFLAAPAFAAAMQQRQVLTTIPVGRRVLLVAEIPIPAGCPLVGVRLGTVSTATRSKVIALQPRGGDRITMPAPADHVLAGGDRLVAVATRTGLAELSARASQRPSGPGSTGLESTDALDAESFYEAETDHEPPRSR